MQIVGSQSIFNYLTFISYSLVEKFQDNKPNEQTFNFYVFSRIANFGILR